MTCRNYHSVQEKTPPAEATIFSFSSPGYILPLFRPILLPDDKEFLGYNFRLKYFPRPGKPVACQPETLLSCKSKLGREEFPRQFLELYL